jgi:hypothetical protein
VKEQTAKAVFTSRGTFIIHVKTQFDVGGDTLPILL